MNIAAHLAAQAGSEILVTSRSPGRSWAGTLERRHLSLKGYPIDAAVLTPAPAAALAVGSPPAK
jgi:hypothetical protein